MAYDIKDLLTIAITFVAVGVAIAFGLSVQTDVRDDFKLANCGLNSSGGTGGTIAYSACGYEYNASQSAIEANANLSSKMPILGTIVVAAVVIGVLLTAFLVNK